MRARRPDIVEQIQVLHVRWLAGAGVDGDAARMVDSYFSAAGELLAENDPMPAAPHLQDPDGGRRGD